MKKSDRQLGMHREISRRDFIHDVSVSSLGLFASSSLVAGCGEGAPTSPSAYYPPTQTGMRGSHPGSFDAMHAIARAGQSIAKATDFDETYDLVVVGGGISGLAAAYFYRKKFGNDARILILENHDDFGGHAKRNEFHQGGKMRLSWGGTMNLEFREFSDTVNALLGELGVDIDALLEGLDFDYGYGPVGNPGVYFDAKTYGRDVLVHDFSLRAAADSYATDKIEQFPISGESRESLKQFYARRENVFEGLSDIEVDEKLASISYIDFLKEYGGLTDEAAELFVKTTHGYWGLGTKSLSVAECLGAGLPVMHLLGGATARSDDAVFADRNVAMFPDGNATIARLLVQSLIPTVAPGIDASNIAMAEFDYGTLDKASNKVRLRLSATATHVANTQLGTRVSYVRDGQVQGVSAKHTVLACYHSVIPHICPELPEPQRRAQRYLVKRPLLLTNVLLRNSNAFDALELSGAFCPGRLHASVWQIKGVNTAGYHHDWDDDGTVPIMFWGSVAPPDDTLHPNDQHRASRATMLSMTFEDYEREVREVLDGMLGASGFKVAEDILAITVNRWPHGYSYDYLDLWEPDWPDGGAPHEIARQKNGNITIANADAGADAYTHVAIDQAQRAINEIN